MHHASMRTARGILSQHHATHQAHLNASTKIRVYAQSFTQTWSSFGRDRPPIGTSSLSLESFSS